MMVEAGSEITVAKRPEEFSAMRQSNIPKREPLSSSAPQHHHEAPSNHTSGLVLCETPNTHLRYLFGATEADA
jgi:hypothetical protein